MATNRLPILLEELAYFRARLTFTKKTMDIWDGMVARWKTVEVVEDDQGIERGWFVGVVVILVIENGGGVRFMQQAMMLVDKVVAGGRWSDLDNCAFRILFSEMLLRSYSLEATRPQEKVDNVNAALVVLNKTLADRGIEMPMDWRAMDPDAARAFILHHSRPRTQDN